MTNLKENYIKTGNVTTRFWETGTGHPVIMLHGGGAGADAFGNWNKIMPTFAELGYRAIAFDAVGFGRSDKPDPQDFDYGLDSRVDQLLHFINALDLNEVTLIGNSMGGATSIGVAINQPERIKRLVLMGSGGRLKPVKGSNSLQTLFDYQVGREYMYNIIRNLTNEEFEVDEQMLDYRLELTKLPGIMEAYQATMKSIQEKGLFFDDEQLKSIFHNTLLIHGKNDRMIPIATSFELLEIMNNAWLYALPHCGHWAMLEYPEEFTRITTDFIKNH